MKKSIKIVWIVLITYYVIRLFSSTLTKYEHLIAILFILHTSYLSIRDAKTK